jgi:hypothetical protein
MLIRLFEGTSDADLSHTHRHAFLKIIMWLEEHSFKLQELVKVTR